MNIYNRFEFDNIAKHVECKTLTPNYGDQC